MLLLLLTSVKTVNVLPDERAEPGHKTRLRTRRCCFDELIPERVTVWHISTTVEWECDEEPVKKGYCLNVQQTVSDFMGCLDGGKNFNELDE